MSSLRIRHLLVAGGAGFMGSAFVRDRLRGDPDLLMTIVDRRDDALPEHAGDPRVRLVRGDIRDAELVDSVARLADATIDFASDEFAESPVGVAGLARTDAEGTAVLLEAARRRRHQRFLLVSTADVYASSQVLLREEDLLGPATLAAASRAGAEMIALAYGASEELPVLVTRHVVAYGPRQPSTQLVGRLIAEAVAGNPLVLTDKGQSHRDFLHVDDHVGAIARVVWKGQPGAVYNVGSGVTTTDEELANLILDLSRRPASLKRPVPGGYRGRRIVDARRMKPLGWEPKIPLRVGLQTAIDWYRKALAENANSIAV